jgi:hypothetical protein
MTLLILACISLVAAAYAGDAYVTVSGSGLRNGSDWANAMDNRSFAAALLTALPGDVFHLAEGEYIPYFDLAGQTSAGERTKTFILREGVSIRGGYDSAGNPIVDAGRAISAVRLTGVFRRNVSRSNSAYHVVTVVATGATGGTGSSHPSSLHFLTLAGGYANGGWDNSKGAGIHIAANAGAGKAVELSHVCISGNMSTGEGGGIYIGKNAAVSIRHSQISGNSRITSSDLWGGGICIAGGRLSISDSRIENNVAGRGGGIRVVAGRLESRRCVYAGNSVGSRGGAVETSSGSVAVFHSDSLAGNSASLGGGLINESRSEIRLANCVLTGNTASEGGGLYNSGDSKAEIDSCIIELNKAMRSGGGVDNGGQMRMTVVRITGNSAGSGGGGIRQNGILAVNHSEISDNTAGKGGGLYTENSSATLSVTTVSGNAATVNGGGIYHRSGKCELNYITLAANSAPAGKSSGIHAIAYPSIRSSIISGNSGMDDFTGGRLHESGAGNSYSNIIGADFYAYGNRSGSSLAFDAANHLGTLAFNRGAFTRTHALKWKDSSADNPASGMAQYDAAYAYDQTGFARYARYPAAGAYEEPFFRAYSDRLFAGNGGNVGDSLNILANDAYHNCIPAVTLLDQPKLGTASVRRDSIFVYQPNAGVKGVDTLRYRIECPGGLRDSATITVNTGVQYDHPQNIRDETFCMEDMPPVNFKVALKIVNSGIKVDGFSIPLAGDLNGDGKPEIVGLGAVAHAGGDLTGLSASGKSIVIYDGQTGSIQLNFELDSLGPNRFTSSTGYGTQDGFHLRSEPRHNSYSHLAIADLDRDGIGEIVVAETGSGKVYALKPTLSGDGKITGLTKMWDADVPHNSPHIRSSYSNNSIHTFGAPVPYISDLNGDGIPEVIVYNKIYNGKTGTLELELETLNDFDDPEKSASNYSKCRTDAYVGRLPGADFHDDWMPVMAINDVDGDGIMEIIAGSKIYKPVISNPSSTAGNTFSVKHGPESVTVNRDTYYLTDGFTVVADIDGDGVSDVIVVKRHTNRTHFLIYVWDPREDGNAALKATLAVRQDSYTGHFSAPFVGDINGRRDGWKNGAYSLKLPEICLTMGRLNNTSAYPIPEHSLSKFPKYTNSAFTNGDGSGQYFRGHVVAFTYDAAEPEVSKRLKLSWMMKHSDGSHQTGLVMFDFDADGIAELVYRDETSLRVISPASRADSLDFVNLKMDEISHPSVIRFRETGISSYTGFECPVVADVNGDGSADIITFGYRSNSSTSSSGGHLFVYEAAGESWAPARPVWNQGIYYPLQINDDLTVPRHPQSTLTKYWSKLPNGATGDTIQPFNGQWIQQPVVRRNNYVPVMMKPDPSLPVDSIRIVSSSAGETVIELQVENRGEATANSNTPLAFYHSSIDTGNIIGTFVTGTDIFVGETLTVRYTLKGDFRDKIIYARAADDGLTFPAGGYLDCNLSNNVAYAMQLTAVDDRYTLAAGKLSYLNISGNDAYNRRSLKPEISIRESALHGVSLVVADTLISYMPDAGFQGIDTIRYRIQCTYNNITTSDEATVYILVLQPSSLEYHACPGASMLLELKPLAGVQFDWYGAETGGNILSGGSSTGSFTHVKGSADETLWVEATVPSFSAGQFPRYRFDLLLASSCGSLVPSGCMVDGTLLFHEDFGGNLPSDMSVSDSCIARLTGYACSKQYVDNSYTLRKQSGGLPQWLDTIDDHTHAADTLRGYMIQFKTAGVAGDFYEYLFDDLCEGSKLYFSAWIASISKTPASDRADIMFSVEDMNGSVIARYYTGSVDGSPVWKTYGFPFTVPYRVNSVLVKISGNGKGNSSFVMDDVKLHLCVPQAVLSDDGMREICEGAQHVFRGTYADDGSFSNSLDTVRSRASTATNDFPPAMNGFPPAVNGFPPAVNGFPPAVNGFPPAVNCFPPAANGFPPAVNGFPPAVNGILPAMNDSPPAMNGALPAMNAAVPAMTGAVPAMNGALPAMNGALPAMNGVLPAMNGALPAMNGVLPAMNGALPRGSTPPAVLTYRFEFRENAQSPWQVIEENSLADPLDVTKSVTVKTSGYYRFIAGRKDVIDCKNCVAASNEIYLKAVKCNSLVRDSELVRYEGSASFNVLANDTLSCGGVSAALFDTLAGSGLRLGSLVINADSSFTYTARAGVSGIDSLKYLIACSGITDTGQVYVFVNRLVPLHYACAGDSVRIGFPAVPGVRYVWYDSVAGGSPVGGVLRDSLSLVRGGSADAGQWWIQPEWNGIAFPRFALSLLDADNCGTAVPSGCLADGTLLLRDDSAGNAGTSGLFFSTRIDGLCENSHLLFSARIAGTPNAAGTVRRSNLIFTLEDTAGNIHADFSCHVPDPDMKLKNYGFGFTVPAGHSSFLLKIRNISGGGNGSFAMDGVEIRLCAPKIRFDRLASDTLVCRNRTLILNAGYPDAGNPFGASVDYRWEFRHVDSAVWRTLDEQTAAVPLNVSWKIDSAGKSDEGYYRLLTAGQGKVGSRNCRAASDSVRLRIASDGKAADVRIQISPAPDRVVNLTSFLDSVEYTGVKWTSTSRGAPAILAGTDETTGSVNSRMFTGNSTFSYKYALLSQCGSSEAKVYVHASGHSVRRTPDTVRVCRSHESAGAVCLNQILGLELGGTWICDSSVNPDNTVADNVRQIPPPSKYAGMTIFNAANAWKTAPAIYKTGYSSAKVFKFVYRLPMPLHGL